MRVRRSLGWMLAAGIIVCAAGNAAELPISDFVRIPKLTHPAISPDGKHLAVVVNAKAESTKARYQIAFGRWYFNHAIGTLQAAYAISPASMLKHFNVPVLIAHGKDDLRVPYQNATELRSALDEAGKPCEWLAEPGEGHGFINAKDNQKLFTMAKHIGPQATSVASASK